MSHLSYRVIPYTLTNLIRLDLQIAHCLLPTFTRLQKYIAYWTTPGLRETFSTSPADHMRHVCGIEAESLMRVTFLIVAQRKSLWFAAGKFKTEVTILEPTDALPCDIDDECLVWRIRMIPPTSTSTQPQILLQLKLGEFASDPSQSESLRLEV